jgi:maltooligosyltrehalose trehalohydrolase
MPIDRSEVGAHVSGQKVTFGVYLPGVSELAGFEVSVLVIHAADQFTPEIPPAQGVLGFNPAHPLGLWSGTLDLAILATPASQMGKNGRHFYRFQLSRNGQLVSRTFLDPFAIETGPGLLGAFTIGPTATFTWSDQKYLTSPLDELIIYELNTVEFNTTFQGVIDRLPYLLGLGVNCIELMPITPVKTEFDWGYGPIGYFAPEDYLGGPAGLKALVDAAHAKGIAVILDVVYGHADGAAFAYAGVYDAINDGAIRNPMMQTPNRDQFGRGFDHNLEFARQYCFEANKNWLDEYHVDGFRYDNVPGFYDGNPLQKYGTLAFNTYVHSRGIPRFADPGGFSRIIQIAEDLDDPRGILRQTFTSATWQDALLGKAENMASNGGYVDEDFAHLLDPTFGSDPYPETKDASPAGDKPFPVAPVQYLNSHDHSWLITNFGLLPPLAADDIRFGDRSRFYELQPFAIALLSCRGVPMLWEGEEFGENYLVAGAGSIRISFQRGMHWEYFYDDDGSPLVKVYRRMGHLRRALPCLRSRDFFYYNVESRPGNGIIAFRRRASAAGGLPEQVAVIVLNFSAGDQTITLPAPLAGTYREMLDRFNRPAGTEMEVTAASAGDTLTIAVPSHYGRVYVTAPPSV